MVSSHSLRFPTMCSLSGPSFIFGGMHPSDHRLPQEDMVIFLAKRVEGRGMLKAPFCTKFKSVTGIIQRTKESLAPSHRSDQSTSTWNQVQDQQSWMGYWSWAQKTWSSCPSFLHRQSGGPPSPWKDVSSRSSSSWHQDLPYIPTLDLTYGLLVHHQTPPGKRDPSVKQSRFPAWTELH